MMQKNKQLQTALQSTVLAAKIAGINTAPVTKTKVSGGDDAGVVCRVFFEDKNGGKSSMKSWMLNIHVYCIYIYIIIITIIIIIVIIIIINIYIYIYLILFIHTVHILYIFIQKL